MSEIKIDTLTNRLGTKTVPVDTVAAGSAKAWVNFNGTGTVAILDSFNVASITDNDVGDYTINFIDNMPNISYLSVLGNNGTGIYVVQSRSDQKTVSSCPVRTYVSSSGAAQDASPGIAILAN